jgi:hypothetical protein
MQIDMLILGLGWQGKFVYDYLKSLKMNVQATTRTGREGTIKWQFDPLNPSLDALPKTKCILITFPLPSPDSGKLIKEFYEKAHGLTPNLILYGSTRGWTGNSKSPWCDRHGPVTPDARYQSEEFFLMTGGCVLNLSGLWGGIRDPKGWLDRVAVTKHALKFKRSLHLIHGLDVARLTKAVYDNFTPGERWIVTDMRVYDWWELVLGWEESGDERKEWVRELISESEIKIKSLPRQPELLERCLDSTEVWSKFGLLPLESLYHPR